MSRRKKRKPLKLLTVPKVQDDSLYQANAETRHAIADQQAAAIAEAVAICGPGATAYGRWQMVDRSKREADRFIYCCRRPDRPGWFPPIPEGGEWDEKLGPDTHPGFRRLDDKDGTKPLGYPFRWEQRFNFLGEYVPQSAERMKAAAEKRRAKALAENAKRVAEQQEWERRNVAPSLLEWAGIGGDGK